MLDFEKAQRMSLTLQVEDKFKSALIVGTLKPGARLVTKEIAEEIGTSITPVREALLRLVSSGALDATPAHAFLVPEISLERYHEIITIRKNLEGVAVGLAARHMDKSKLARLRQRYDMFLAAKHADVEAALQANQAFFFQLFEHAEMPTLTMLIEQLWVRVGPCYNYLYTLSKHVPLERYHYDDLLEALTEKDDKRCVSAIHKAIDGGADILRQQYVS